MSDFFLLQTNHFSINDAVLKVNNFTSLMICVSLIELKALKSKLTFLLHL